KYGLRLVLFFSGILFSLLAWFLDSDNQFTTWGVFFWILSVFCWLFFVNNLSIPFEKWFNRENLTERLLRPFRQTVHFQFHLSWVVPAMAVILIVGASFRFGNLDAYPPDMTSDHVEKLLDSGKIYDGMRPVFLPNNGGREAFQMYFLAVLKE